MKLFVLFFLTVHLLAASDVVFGREYDPRELILEARKLAQSYGDQVWPGYSDAPFGVLLVDGDTERIFCHQWPLDGFLPASEDEILRCSTAARPATFPPGILASFPAVGGKPTIVIGTPEQTGKSPEEWMLTVLHEHFHQLQYSRPDYYQGTAALNLSGGDESGMWMLNYPFPYEREETADAFNVMADRLLVALESRNKSTFGDALIIYWAARKLARNTLSDADWRYLELQLWQEGVARWTEGAIAALSDTYALAAESARAQVRQELLNLDLRTQKRVAFYPIGAAEAALLEAGGREWRTSYWAEPFTLRPQLKRLVDRVAHDNVVDAR